MTSANLYHRNNVNGSAAPVFLLQKQIAKKIAISNIDLAALQREGSSERDRGSSVDTNSPGKSGAIAAATY